MIKLTITSADAKRKEVEALAQIEKAQREVFNALREQRVEKLAALIFNEAKRYIDLNTSGCCEILLLCHKIDQWRAEVSGANEPWDYQIFGFKSELTEAIDIVIRLLQEAGYEMGEGDQMYVYSKSWQERSGKYGRFFVRY